MKDPAGRQYMYDNGQYFIGNRAGYRQNLMTKNRAGLIAKHSKETIHVGRNPILTEIDKYLSGVQYDHLQDWESEAKLEDKKPKLIYPFMRIFGDRVGTKLLGSDVFPTLDIEEDEETTYFINKVILPDLKFKPFMLAVAKDLVVRTSAFVRFSLVEGKLIMEKYNSNHCYPKFDAKGDLVSVEIKYVYKTNETKAGTGEPIYRWFRMVLGQEKDVKYNNPEYKRDEEPKFEVVASAEHGLGYVQGEWFKTGANKFEPEGEPEPILYKMRSWIDSFNYNLSLSDRAVNYGTDPQLVLNGITEDEADDLSKSVTKSWILGREGEANYLEISGSGVENARVQRDDYVKKFQDICRIVLLDPERMVGSAQSGKAMEILHQPMVELVTSVRPWVEPSFKNLITKMIITVLALKERGVESIYNTPEGWVPQSLNLSLNWPPIFSLTVMDMQQIISMFLQLTNGNIISRDTALKRMQAMGVDLGVTDYILEEQKVNTQKEFNSFTF